MARRRITASYRLQLRPGFTFDDASAVVPYLADLGVSHVYTSPFLAAAEGSEHGYDVVDPTRVRDDLGGQAGFDRFIATLDAHELGLIVDVVPHHMSIAAGNRWWREVLMFGAQAATAAWFDIDWHSEDERSRSRVVLPVLGDHYGRLLEDGTIRLARSVDGEFFVCAHDLELPVTPSSLARLLREVGETLDLGRLRFLADALGTATPEGALEAMALVSEVEQREPVVRLEIAKAIDRANADPDALDSIVDAQHYRLAKWTMAAYELDYRRFFDINSLVALRAERDDVFEATHALVVGWARDGIVDGLRIDHIDGLRDPAAYLARLRAAVGPEITILVEKILGRGEALPDWPVEGTTGYESASAIGAVLVDPEGAEALRRAYVDFTSRPERYRDVSIEKRRLVLRSILASDVERLASLLVQTCARRRRARDFTRVELREALCEIVVHVPAYRSYVAVRDRAAERTIADLNFIDLAIGRAREARPDLDSDVFDLLRDVLVGDVVIDDALVPEAIEVALRAQQLTGPAVAKGDEDAAHYAWAPLLSANEVGNDPDEPAMDPSAFSTFIEERALAWPGSMITTATHDTKRSEDVRARLTVLAEIPERWADAVERWWKRSAAWRDDAVDPATAWFVFQTLVGAHPLAPDRAGEHFRKAIREAKEHTSWTSPDPAYEHAVERLVSGALADDELMGDVAALVDEIDTAGRVNALAQVALRLTLPGFPDTYQGTELWDDSLVDPDNRRPVDFEARRQMLARAREIDAEAAWREERASGLPKVVLLDRLLHLRQRRGDAFATGAPFAAIETIGDGALAYLRGSDVAVVVPRLPMSGPGGTTIGLPEGGWRDVVTGAEVISSGSVTLGDLVERFPVAVLERH